MLYIFIKDFQEDVVLGVIFLNKGQLFQVGEKFVQYDLVRMLCEISNKGIDGFYKGWVGQVIVVLSKVGGGLIM